MIITMQAFSIFCQPLQLAWILFYGHSSSNLTMGEPSNESSSRWVLIGAITEVRLPIRFVFTGKFKVSQNGVCLHYPSTTLDYLTKTNINIFYSSPVLFLQTSSLVNGYFPLVRQSCCELVTSIFQGIDRSTTSYS